MPATIIATFILFCRSFVAGMARSYAKTRPVPQLDGRLVPTHGPWSTLCRQWKGAVQRTGGGFASRIPACDAYPAMVRTPTQSF